jgi:hypothetical protein
MTPEIEKEIVLLIKAAKEAGSDAAAFIGQQAPDVIAQLVRWNVGMGIIELVFGLVILVGAYKLFMVTYRKVDDGMDDIVWVPAGVLIGIAIVAGPCLAYSGAITATKAVLAPKVLVIEAISNLARSVK